MQGLSTLSEMIVRPKRNVSLNQYVYLLDTVLQAWYYNNSNMTNMTDSRTFTRVSCHYCLIDMTNGY